MKKIIASISMIALAMLTLNSCKKKEEIDKTNDNTTTISTNNGDENKKLSVTELSAGVKIEEATEKTGTPPAPNSQLNFQMSSEKQQAILNEGFDIKFTSTEDIKGAYIRLADVDGNKTDGYFDVPVTINSTRPTVDSTSNANDYEIDIDFEQSLTPGKFCYFICVYNSANQVSQIQEVCITVKAWGGNNELVGTWKAIEKKGKDYYTWCQGGDSVLLKDKIIKSESLFTFNIDGTYLLNINSESQKYDDSASVQNCDLIYRDIIIKEDLTFSGNWSYDSDFKTLTLIEYKMIDNINNITNIYEDGEPVEDRTLIEIVNNQVIYKDSDGNSVITLIKK